MRFKYLGPNSETTVFGLTFPQGETVEVTSDYAIVKLSAHPLFEEVDKPKRGRKGQTL